MSKHLTVINILWTVVDTIVCIVGISVFLWASWFFHSWWLILPAIIPLALFNQHSLVIDADIAAAQCKADIDKLIGEEVDHNTANKT